MKNLTVLIFVVVFVSQAAALATSPTLFCRADIQPNGPGTDAKKVALSMTKQDINSMTLAAEYQGYTFEVDRDFSLTTLYMRIEKDGKRLAVL